MCAIELSFLIIMRAGVCARAKGF